MREPPGAGFPDEGESGHREYLPQNTEDADYDTNSRAGTANTYPGHYRKETDQMHQRATTITQAQAEQGDTRCRCQAHVHRAASRPTLILTHDDMLAWKVPIKPHGSEGVEPRDPAECPYFWEHGADISCISGSGGSICMGYRGGDGDTAYCVWGIPAFERQRAREDH